MATARVNKKARKPILKTIKKSSTSHKHFYLTLGIFGILCVVLSNFYLWHERTKYSFATTPTLQDLSSQSVLRSLPRSLSIPTLHLSIPIEEGVISGGIWQISPNEATHLTGSAVPSEKGNIIIYGHNKKKIFGNLYKMEIGDPITITTDNGQQHTYVVQEKLTVEPTDLSVVNPTLSEVLTIYTCSGFFDSQRLIIRAIRDI